MSSLKPPSATADAARAQFVTFAVNGELFALPMSAVREIIRMPDVVRVPMSPHTLLGVSNLRGQVLPVVSLRRSFAMDDRAVDDATRVIVIEHGALVGLTVDRVASVMTVEPERIESAAAVDSTIDARLLSGILKGVGDRGMAMILDLDVLVRERRVAGDQAGADRALRTRAQDVSAAAAQRHLVSFVVAGQEYAFPIERVHEIVQYPADISRVPKAAAHVLGMMTLRNRLLPLVGMRQMFRLPPADPGLQQRIVVVGLGRRDEGGAEEVVGIVMDAVKEVLRVPATLIDPLPRVLDAGSDRREIEAVCRLDDGRRIVSILAVDRLFDEGAAAALRADAARETAARGSRRPAQVALDAQLVVFRLDGQEYGVRIDRVQEIIRVPELMTRIPSASSDVSGVVNLRGQILPVIDFRRRFGLSAVARDERQRIIVLTHGGALTGYVVDSVSEVTRVPNSAIEPVQPGEGGAADLVGAYANLQSQRRMILLLAAERLQADAVSAEAA
jgi:purine-binding chemotaxis protein CheW